MKKKIIYGLLFAVAMVTASSSFVSCKDYEGDDYAALKEKNASLEAYLNSQIAVLRQAINDCGTNCSTARAALEDRLHQWVEAKNYLTQADLNGYATEAWVNQKNYATQTWVLEQINANSQTFVDAVNSVLVTKDYMTQQDLSNYYTKAEIDQKISGGGSGGSGDVTQADLDALRNYIILGDSVRNAYVWASYTYQRIQALQAMSDSLKHAYETADAANAQAQMNKDSIKILGASIYSVEQRAYQNYLDAKALADSAISLANRALDSCHILDVRVADLETAYKAADAQLQTQIDELTNRVAANEAAINNILGTLKKQITGVIIQAAYSTVLGNGSLPLGIQTNLLAAYASKATADVDFPSIYNEDYADGTTVLTDADKAYLDKSGFWPATVSLAKGDYVISDRDDNAGKLYLTVNPTNIDFEGTEFALVNSKGQESRMQLTPLKASEEVLNFGWTRSVGVENASANGFYEVNAKVTKENIEKMQANINTEMFKKAFKEQLNSKGTGLVSYAAAMDLARAVYSSLEPLQRFGVRATWQDATVDGGERSYTSAFDIAATVIKPLGFGFTIPENKYTRFPVFDTEYLKNKFHIKGDFSLDVITDKATSEKKIRLIVEESKIQGLIFNSNYVTLSANESYMYTKDGSFIILDVTPLYNEIYGDLAASLTPYQDVIRQANDRIDYLVSYIDKYNYYATKANKFISNANNLLQPVILWCDGQNVGQLGGMISGNYAAGTVVPVGGAVALVPTSYTLELLAPAFKKSVVVSNVYKDGESAQSGNSDLDAAAKAINAALKEGNFDLYEGHSLKNAFIFNADSKYEGMTFEFAYTALDYTGQVAGRKFYLTVK